MELAWNSTCHFDFAMSPSKSISVLQGISHGYLTILLYKEDAQDQQHHVRGEHDLEVEDVMVGAKGEHAHTLLVKGWPNTEKMHFLCTSLVVPVV